MEKIYKNDPAIEEGLLKLLEIKDSDIRNSILQQGLDAIDHGVHAGGAFSAVVPMVSLYYGGGMKLNVEQPTEPGQDQFILSKGHAVAALAAVYADKGYFDAELLKGSRSYESILNGVMCTAWSATAKCRRAAFGKRLCTALKRGLTTCASSWTKTADSLIM